MLDGKVVAIKVANFCLDDQEILKSYDDQPSDHQFQIWTDISGTKKVELKLLGFQKGQYQFLSRGGKTFLMRIDNFCTKDQEVLKKLIPQSVDNGFRIWTDISGTKKIEAKLIGIQDGKAKFQLKTGQTGTMNIQSLSEADQELLRQLQKQKSPT
jgi:hypothetical protein